jgi:hypothetical protein
MMISDINVIHGIRNMNEVVRIPVYLYFTNLYKYEIYAKIKFTTLTGILLTNLSNIVSFSPHGICNTVIESFI